MTEKKPIKSELHHWWPRSLFKFWVNSQGVVNQLFTDGRVVPHKKARNYGAIQNAHIIKLANTPTVWDENFEKKFDAVDSGLSAVVQLLEDRRNLVSYASANNLTKRFHPCHFTAEELDLLLEVMLSLVVRSPRFRNSIAVNVNGMRARSGGDLPPASLALLNLNQRDAFKIFYDGAKGRGKFALLFSDEDEFIFGDGFYQNYKSSAAAPMMPRILIPLTPHICVFYNLPHMYSSNTRTVMMKLSQEEIRGINFITQVYSGNEIFYRSQDPELTDEFRRKEFLEFAAGHPSWVESLALELKNHH